MAKVLYDPKDMDSPHHTTVLGIDFTGGAAPVTVQPGPKLDKFRLWQQYHPELGFSVIEDEPAKTGLQAVHRGRGVYAVVDDGVPLDKLDPMTKEQADAFNALSAEDKAVFVDQPAAPPAA